jgi:hypothetical protein
MYRAPLFPIPFAREQIFGDPFIWRTRNLARVEAAALQQHNRCPVCGEPPTSGRHKVLEIDHCHSTHYIRSLLCHNCNFGRFGENISVIRRYADYLEFHRRIIERRQKSPAEAADCV